MEFNAPRWPPDWPELLDSVEKVMRSGDWGRYHSPVCDAFSRALRDWFQSESVRLCCSGTAALEMGLRAANVRGGDEVVLSAYDYPGNLRTVELLGAKPVLLDVEPGKLSFSADQLRSLSESADAKGIRAVVASHLFGDLANTPEMRVVCDRMGWVLIEDLCQSPGARVQSAETRKGDGVDGGDSSAVGDSLGVAGQIDPQQLMGTFGHLTTLSFGGSKLLSAGSGGALLVNDARLGARLASWVERPGDVYSMSPLQAAVLIPQLDRVEAMRDHRNVTWQLLRRERLTHYSQWKWLGGDCSDSITNPYKIAWLAESAEQRTAIISAAESIGLPIGAGYRSFAKLSDRRCRKIDHCGGAAALGEQLFVLDHRALLVESRRTDELLGALDAVYAEVESV
ncbi:MAG: DegT/DnrJ/EryC1/StrS family aminotransferase [Rubripirellula sp.]